MKELCCLPPLPLDAETGGAGKSEMEVDFVAGEVVAELLLGEVSTGNWRSHGGSPLIQCGDDFAAMPAVRTLRPMKRQWVPRVEAVGSPQRRDRFDWELVEPAWATSPRTDSTSSRVECKSPLAWASEPLRRLAPPQARPRLKNEPEVVPQAMASPLVLLVSACVSAVVLSLISITLVRDHSAGKSGHRFLGGVKETRAEVGGATPESPPMAGPELPKH